MIDRPDLAELARKALTSEGFYEIKDRRRTTDEVHALAQGVLAALAQVETLREALSAYRSALRSGEKESAQLKALSDAAFEGALAEGAPDA